MFCCSRAVQGSQSGTKRKKIIRHLCNNEGGNLSKKEGRSSCSVCLRCRAWQGKGGILSVCPLHFRLAPFHSLSVFHACHRYVRIRKAYEPHDLYNSHPRVSSCTKGYRNTYNSVNMKHYENDKQPGQTVFLLIPASSPGHKGPATRAIF